MRNLQEEANYHVLRILHANSAITQRELAEQLGISLGSINYCLKALVVKGLVKIENFQGSNNKFGYIYVLTPQGLSERAALTKRFLARKLKEYALLQAEIEALKEDEMSLRVEPAPDAVPLSKATRRRTSVTQAQPQ
jgi:EPS-associated MarR family transcriptional regulator